MASDIFWKPVLTPAWVCNFIATCRPLSVSIFVKSDNSWLIRIGAKGLPKTLSARDGAIEPYRDVFTGFFWEAFRP
ncbi:MAG: hypothetical protein ACI92N_002588, partial [Pseudomonadales bacterium]